MSETGDRRFVKFVVVVVLSQLAKCITERECSYGPAWMNWEEDVSGVVG